MKQRDKIATDEILLKQSKNKEVFAVPRYAPTFRQRVCDYGLIHSFDLIKNSHPLYGLLTLRPHIKHYEYRMDKPKLKVYVFRRRQEGYVRFYIEYEKIGVHLLIGKENIAQKVHAFTPLHTGERFYPILRSGLDLADPTVHVLRLDKGYVVQTWRRAPLDTHSMAFGESTIDVIKRVLEIEEEFDVATMNTPYDRWNPESARMFSEASHATLISADARF